MRRHLCQRSVGFLAAVLVLSSGSVPVLAQEDAEETETVTATTTATLPIAHRQWLERVVGLITEEEREYFLGLKADYRREAFIEAFWRIRDPEPRTSRNELKERWQELLAGAGGVPLGDARSLMFLLNGPPTGWQLPDGRPVAQCFSRTRELEIWFYSGSDRTTRRFLVVFFQRTRSQPYEVWLPGTLVRAAQRNRLPTRDNRLLCADELFGYATGQIGRIARYDQLLDEVLSPPTPPSEWLATFRAGTTDLPDGAETFQVTSSVQYPGRNLSRTAVEVRVDVPLTEAPGREFGGDTFHNFVLNGEILRDEQLFESFSYRFEGPTPPGVDSIPLGFTRFLRQGDATLRLLVEDVFGGQVSQVIEELEVPSVEGRPSVRKRWSALEDRGADAEASIRLLAPASALLEGMQRFTARTGGDIDRVAFFLDEKQVLSKRRPPYSVELDLGDVPQPRRVRAVAYFEGAEVATDQLWLNQGNQRFRLRLVEPRTGGIYPGSFTVRPRIDAPAEEAPERIELFLNEDRVAVITEQPYARTVRLERTEPTVVRAVAYLSDGTTAEDAVVINSADLSEEVDVRLVEVLTRVTDRDGLAVPGLTADDFDVRIGEVRQQVIRADAATTQPLSVAVAVDRSSSMIDRMDVVSAAAAALLNQALERGNSQGAVVSFAEQLSVDATFGSELPQLERALAGLVARGGTRLYDGLSAALSRFEAGPGARALLVFSDGRDEGSTLDANAVAELARQRGVLVFLVGSADSFEDRAARQELSQLVERTGGEAFFLEQLEGELEGTFLSVLERLSTAYTVVFQVSQETLANEEEDLEILVDGARTRHRSRP